jgi:hypothetical protein
VAKRGGGVPTVVIRDDDPWRLALGRALAGLTGKIATVDTIAEWASTKKPAPFALSLVVPPETLQFRAGAQELARNAGYGGRGVGSVKMARRVDRANLNIKRIGT